MVSRAWISLLLIGMCVSAGCRPHTGRLEISGKVSLNGTPIDGGSIRFTSLGEKKMASGAMVNNGRYDIPPAKGLLPGSYHVEINAPDNAAKPIIYRSSPDAPGIPTQPERIPAEYNVDSKKTIEVTTSGNNHFDFEIVSIATK